MKDIRDFIDEYRIKRLACSFSGGKSSLVATHYTLTNLQDSDIKKYVVFADTTVIIPPAVEYVKECFKEIFEPLGAECVITRPKKEFWTYLEEGWLIPSFKRRWCRRELKIIPLFTFFQRNRIDASIIGFRKDETNRRQQFPTVMYRRSRWWSGWSIAVIRDMTRRDVENYIKENSLPVNPCYGIGLKESCICGAYTGKKGMEIVRANFPEIFNKFVEYEERQIEKGYSADKIYHFTDMAKQKMLFDDF